VLTFTRTSTDSMAERGELGSTARFPIAL